MAADPDPVLDLVRSGGGGRFWLPEVSIDGRIDVLLAIGGDAASAASLWESLRAERPDARVLVVFEGEAAVTPCAGMVWRAGVNPHSVIKRAAEIRSDHIGEIALLGALLDVPVTIDDGLAEDGVARKRALTGTRVLEWLRRGVAWRSPFTGASMELGEASRCVTDARRAWMGRRGIAACVGMAWWKRRRMWAFMAGTEKPVLFCRSAARAVAHARRNGGDIAVWRSRVPAGLFRRATQAGVGVRFVEDGFLRSVGLGSDLLPPSSIVMDSRGIYFDPSRPSDLEHILATTVFDDALRARGRALADNLVRSRVSKYGASAGAAPVLNAPSGARILLVPGQVSDDLSIRLGSPLVRDNLDLLENVKRDNPEAFIVFRPHPDVDAGHRTGAIPDSKALRYADRVLRGGSMTDLIASVHEIHTMTSLAGFEGLLRGRHVVTYGQPFYAGWGLTDDRAGGVPRRGRELRLEELVVATLVLYPFYLDPVTDIPCGPEVLIERLSRPDLWHPTVIMRIRRLQGRLRRWAARRLMHSRRDI